MTNTNLAQALTELAERTDLPERRRRDLMSAITCTAEYLRRPVADIPTDTTRLRRLLASIHPVQAGISAKTLGNVKSNLTAALRIVGLLQEPDPHVTIAPCWEAFLAPSEKPYHRVTFARFINYCCVRDIEPAAVDAELLAAYQEYLERTVLARDPGEMRREASKVWNAVTQYHDGAFAPIPLASGQRYRCPSLSTYPVSLQADIQAYLDRVSHVDPFVEDAPAKPLRPTSLRNIEAHLRQYFGALVEAGMRPDDITSLGTVLTHENIKKAARTISARRDKNQMPVGIHNITATLLGVARHHLNLPDKDLRLIRGFKARVAPSTKGMTSKNRERLGQFHDFNNVIRLLSLPNTLLSMALDRPANATSPHRAMYAAAIAILMSCPMRMKNLASLDIERHVTAHGGGRDRTYSIRIDAAEVKNGVPIEFKLNRENSLILQTYLERFRHRLTHAPSTALFPRTQDGKPRLEAHLGQSISAEVARHTGLRVNPHLFRHIAAYLYLKKQPGDFETVRRILKHKYLQTTMTFYADLSNQWAHDRYDQVVLSKPGGGSA